MADEIPAQTEPTITQPDTLPARGSDPTGDLVKAAEDRAWAKARREYEAKIDALRAEQAEKLKAQPKTAPPPDDRIAALEFQVAFMTAVAEVGPISPAVMARLQKLATVDKPPDLGGWIRGELDALGHKKAEAPATTAAPVTHTAPPNGTAAPAPVPSDPSRLTTVFAVAQARVAGHLTEKQANDRIQQILKGQGSKLFG